MSHQNKIRKILEMVEGSWRFEDEHSSTHYDTLNKVNRYLQSFRTKLYESEKYHLNSYYRHSNMFNRDGYHKTNPECRASLSWLYRNALYDLGLPSREEQVRTGITNIRDTFKPTRLGA